jgi:hypothetical protein
MIARGLFRVFAVAMLAALFLAACSEQTSTRQKLRHAGAQKFRGEILEVCREGFASRSSQEIPAARWPDSARAFQPVGLWAEPDGAYLLLFSDADGERGIYFPRVLSDKDPLCGPTLKHEKWADGVYWYAKKRG